MYSYKFGGVSVDGDHWEVVNSKGYVVAETKSKDMARRVAKGLNLERDEDKAYKGFKL